MPAHSMLSRLTPRLISGLLAAGLALTALASPLAAGAALQAEHRPISSSTGLRGVKPAVIARSRMLFASRSSSM